MSSEGAGANGPTTPGPWAVHIRAAIGNGGEDVMENDAIKGALASLGWLPDELLMQAQIHRNDPDACDAPMEPTEAAAILDSFCMPFTHRDAQRAGARRQRMDAPPRWPGPAALARRVLQRAQ